ncbi:CAP-Gly domain-containing linker protein 1-like [Polypterus senegalus]|uniref:CAP-Gly domain-containing linker protein 1-like n=1 Tax=Polypterus senegalus TaxID=55291 RepID=UPI0019641B6F|nr:CAP-Gly domain-containing linker protein 1-like [Polypterus senegalus]
MALDEIEAISHLREEESITVQVEEVASTDLTNALADIRSEYENFISKQRRQTEAWSNSKMQATTFSQAMTKSGTDAQSSNSQVTNLTVQVQALEIELQLCHRMNKSLEDILQSTESSYSDKLREHQQRAAHLEDELHALRDDIQRQAQDYQVLLDIKNHLETEITDYRHLLDGQETSQKDLEMTAISNNCLPGLNSVQQSKMERDKAAEKEPKMDGLGESVVNLELEPCPEFDIHQELVLGLEVSTNSEQDLQKGPVISQELEPKPVYALATELEPNSKLKARSRSHSAPRMFYRQKERIRHSSCKNVELPLEVESATDVKVKLEPMVFLNAELECTAESSVSLDQNPDQKYEIDIVKSQESASSIDLDQEQQSELLPNQEFILEVKSSISMGSDPEQQSVIIRQGLKPEPASTLTAELEQEAESTIGLDLVSVAGQERELKLDPSINMEPDLQPENIISQEQLPAFVLKAQLEPESKPDINLELKSAQEPVVNIEFELEPESVRLQGLTPESQSAINVEHLE